MKGGIITFCADIKIPPFHPNHNHNRVEKCCNKHLKRVRERVSGKTGIYNANDDKGSKLVLC
jgi:hypothetical protein